MTKTINVVEIGDLDVPECCGTIQGTISRPASFTVFSGDIRVQVMITRDDTAKTVEDKIKRAVAEALNR